LQIKRFLLYPNVTFSSSADKKTMAAHFLRHILPKKTPDF